MPMPQKITIPINIGIISNVFVVATASCFAMGCGDVVSSQNGADASVAIDATVSPDAAPVDPCTADTITKEAFAECYLQAFCTGLTECSGAVETVESCVKLVKLVKPVKLVKGESIILLQRDEIAAALASEDVILDGAAAKACFDGLSSCNNSPDGCSRMLIGQTGQNESCFNGFECGLGGRCLNIADCNMQCCTGICEIPRKLGQSCDTQNLCEAGHYCVGPKGAETCRSGLVGDPCTADFQCSENNRCNAGNVCEPRVVEGAKCGDDNDCVEPLLCVLGVCRATDAVGDPCTNSCNGGLFCNAAQKCETKVPIGGKCSATRPCANNIHVACDRGVCVEKPGVGESCSKVVPCALGLYCEQPAKTCKPRKADGVACVQDIECAGICNSSKVCEAFDFCYE